MDRRQLQGHIAEAAAGAYLQKMGFTVLEVGFDCPFGEIDLVARKDGLIVFAEVRSRLDEDFMTPAESVDLPKQRRIKTTASLWMRRYGRGLDARFDVFEVTPKGIRHIIDAFR